MINTVVPQARNNNNHTFDSMPQSNLPSIERILYQNISNMSFYP